jgi:putative nucleotidyltransferase with HDIG domain
MSIGAEGMAAKMVAVKDLKEGEILDSAVVSPAGKVLLSKDVKLSERAISLMRAWDISFVYIKTEQAEEAQTAQITSVENQDLSAEFIKFYQEYDAAVTMASQAFDFARSQKKVPVQYLKDTSFGIYSAILDRGASVLNNLMISDYNLADKITRHCVMVSYISSMIARHMHMSEEEVEGVTLAALLHDIGKLVQTKGDELGKEHIINAAAMLKDIKGLSPEILFGIIQHHEFMDGTGFPMGVKDSRIHPYARIIAVADLFHSEAYIGENANPFPVLERLTKEQFTKFDTEVCQVFINKVRDSLLKSRVKLSDGSQAEVIYYHSLDSCLPIVRTAEDKIIDLGANTNIKISHIIAPEYVPAMSA